MVRTYLKLGLGALAALGVALACGSKSGLLEGSGRGGSGGGGPGDASAGSGGVGAGGGVGGVGASGGSGGAAGVGGVPVLCDALEPGIATEVMSFPDRHATAPSAVLLDAFSPPRVALQAFATGGSSALHDDIRLARFVIDDTAPAGISLELEPMLVGIESHGWGNLAVAHGAIRAVAVSWHGDPGGFGRPMFRSVDFDTWTPSAPVDLAGPQSGEAVLALGGGASTGSFGVGYAGNGYGVVWRSVQGPSGNSTRPVAAVLDAAGQVMIGPHEVSPPSDYPGRSPTIVWSGTTYLLATAVRTCTAGASPCIDDAMVISRLRPASGDAVDDSGVELAAAIPVTPGAIPGRPSLARDGELVRIAWIERTEPAGSQTARARLATLGQNGDVVEDTIDIALGSEPESRVAVHAEGGVTALLWAEQGDPSLADSALGRSRLVVYRRDSDGALLSAEIPSPLFHSYGSPTLMRRGQPGSLLAVWGARSMKDGHDVSYAARIDCAGARR